MIFSKSRQNYKFSKPKNQYLSYYLHGLSIQYIWGPWGRSSISSSGRNPRPDDCSGFVGHRICDSNAPTTDFRPYHGRSGWQSCHISANTCKILSILLTCWENLNFKFVKCNSFQVNCFEHNVQQKCVVLPN